MTDHYLVRTVGEIAIDTLVNYPNFCDKEFIIIASFLPTVTLKIGAKKD